MEKYLLITLVKGSLGNAGPKAPLDICDFLEKTGKVEVMSFCSEMGMDYPLFLKLLPVFETIKREDRKVILQYPLQPFHYHEKQELYAKLLEYLEPERTWLWVHDVNHLRFKMEYYDDELKWLGHFKKFIVHNGRMERYLKEHIEVTKCIQNEIFDYQCCSESIKDDRKPQEQSLLRVVYAGNLTKEKSPFLHTLSKEEMKFRINIYGQREGLIPNSQINYCGSFQADVLPDKLCGDIGLIWDGEIDSAKDISMQKNYTRYNAPHKFSCYMAAGLPVIAWRESAIAEVIRKYRVGYLIDNLYEINELDLSRYAEYQKNAALVGEKVRSGYFTKRVFEELLRMGEENVFL